MDVLAIANKPFMLPIPEELLTQVHYSRMDHNGVARTSRYSLNTFLVTKFHKHKFDLEFSLTQMITQACVGNDKR